MGAILANFHSFGMRPCSIDFLNSSVIGAEKYSASSDRSLAWISSGPHDLWVFSYFSFFLTIDSVISMLKINDLLRAAIAGTIPWVSRVYTLEK